jgi:V8-like Glu-specific endopeptidase
MKRALTILTLMSLLLGSGSMLRAGGPRGSDLVDVSYYGENDLVDLYQAGILRKFAASSVALFSDRVVIKDEATGAYNLKTISLKDKMNLQPGQPFGDQTVGAFCSGALVGPDLVLTAGHCFAPDERGGPCDRVKLVFGYALNRAGETPSSFPAADVYSCKQIVAQKVQDDGHNFTCRNGSCTDEAITGDGADYALVRLDRKVKGRYPLAISRTNIAGGTEVGVIGYPTGLPVKVQEKGASVRELKNGYFTTNLDTFRGNSGSPVFNMKTLKIEGVVSRGGTDYVYDSTPTAVNDPRRPYNYSPGRANYYPQDGGRGEDATFITEIQALIPVTEAERSIDSMLKVRSTGKQAPKVVPAIYIPGAEGPSVQPAIYTVPDVQPVPATISI